MILRVYANEATDWFVAETAEEAMVLYRQWLESNREVMDESEISAFRMCLDVMELSIIPDHDQSLPAVRKTCAEWAQERGKGFLCTENY